MIQYLKTKQVLVVDSTDNMRTAMIRMLRDMGFDTVHQANNGQRALDIIKSIDIDLIVSEWVLDKISGKKLLVEVRCHERTKNIPFIVCSSIVEQRIIIDALKSGVSEYLAKPFNCKMFQQRIFKVLRKQSYPSNSNIENIDYSPLKEHKLEPTSALESVGIQQEFTVLIVDDEINNIQIASKAVKSIARVQFALNGNKAIQLCRKARPDLILLDIMMPEMDGYQVFNEIQKDIKLADIPIIFITAKANEEDIITGLSLGAVDYVTKPFNLKILSMRVQNQLNTVSHIKLLDQKITESVSQFRMKENVDRILLNYVSQPLTQIDETVERINRRVLNSKQLVKETDFILSASQNIRQIVSCLNSILKLEDDNSQVDKTHLDIYQLVFSVIKRYAQEQYAKSIQVENYITHGTKILGDNVMFATLFSELYINALEATPRGARVSFFESINQNKLTISILNPGAVPDAIKDTFFDKYITHGKKFGTGLGTYAARLICDAYDVGIYLKVENNETRISLTFEVYVP